MDELEKTKFRRILIAVVSLTLVVYIFYQAYMVAYEPVTTEIAYSYTVQDTVDTEVFIARNEEYITNKSKGTIISVAADGSRVAKDQTVAAVFADTSAADTYTKLNDLAASIARYKKMASQSDNYTFKIEDLDKNIDDSVMSLENDLTARKFTQLSDSINDVRDQVVTRQIATGNAPDFRKKLSKLQAEYEALSQKNSKYTSVTSAKSGYYISGVDGYEQLVDCTKINDLTVEDMYAILKTEPTDAPAGAIGKIVTEFTWYMVCVVDSNSIGNLKVGNDITVNLPFSAVNSITATVYAINENNGDKTAVILSCNRMNSDISKLRKENAELVVKSYTGLKVNASAIQVNKKGEKGVFVQNGNLVEFRKLNIIYSTEDFVLSSTDVGKDGYVKLYDNIITEGKDLYDGKIIK